PSLSAALGLSDKGGVWVKDETGNVSGSHKARHLFGILLALEVADRLRGGPHVARPAGGPGRAPLAIASCGNAALAAAVLARAARRPLDCYIPPGASPAVKARLEALGARLVACPRREKEKGDPCYLRFQEALAAGAIPFCCQGPDNGLTIEGGQTLAWEIVTELRRTGETLDRLLVQVGGGALASACVQGFREAVLLGALPRMPRIHAVQTTGAYPLSRAHEILAKRIGAASLEEALRHAATNRSTYMWPWEEEPKSIADGILDDETYDWLAIERGVLETGGSPIVVDEETLLQANELARRTTGIDASHTGTAGLAGLLDLSRSGALQSGEKIAVIFSGARR
ncbi:MAG: pyridoxal-phosphate dependent enzyme, partial [Planctomycetes bacterium]|nr:pyridoxal-phosphate dependent enzyme [Planctomycetota bacterium]